MCSLFLITFPVGRWVMCRGEGIRGNESNEATRATRGVVFSNPRMSLKEGKGRKAMGLLSERFVKISLAVREVRCFWF